MTDAKHFYTVFDPETDRATYTGLTVFETESERDGVIEKSAKSPNPGRQLAITEDEAKAMFDDRIANVAIWNGATVPEWISEDQCLTRVDDDMLRILSGRNPHITAMFIRG